ncbi:MAG: NHL repeat-containing protein [Fusobacteriota bacterium]
MKGISDFSKNESYDIYINEIDNFIDINDKKIKSSFFNPRSFAIYNNNIYISDSYNNLIKVFNLNGDFLYEFGKNELSEPYGIEIYNERVYVVSRNDGNICVYKLKGDFQTRLNTNMNFPSFLKIADEMIYVSNTNDHSICIYNLEGGLIEKITSDFKYPCGIDVTKNYIFVADQYNKRIVKLSKSGVVIKEVLKGSYYSVLKIEKNMMTAYDEKNGSFEKTKIDDIKIDIPEFLKKENRISELGYYYIKNNKLELAVNILQDKKHWNPKYKKENIKISKILQRPKFYEFLLKHYNKKELFLNYVGDARKREQYNFILEDIIGDFDQLRLHRPKAIFIENSNLWISMFKAKLLIKVDEKFKLKEVYEINNQIDKFIVTNREIIIIDYYYRKIVTLNKSDLNKKKEIYKEIKNPVDIIRVKNEIVILDSVMNKVFIYKIRGKKQKEYNIESKEAVAIYYKEEIYYILDKKENKIRKYNLFFELLEEIKLKNVNGPDDIVVDEEYIYITDEGNNRVIKIDKNGKKIFIEDSFLKPRDIILNDKDIYISDFGNDLVKHYVLGEE